MIPKKADVVSKGTTNGFEKDIRWGLNKFYYTTAKRSLKDAYRMLLEARFYKDGKLADAFPSFWQFRYYYRTHNKKQNEMISRKGLIVNKLRYTNRDFVEQFLSGQEATVAYNPDDVSCVWFIEDGRYIPFKLIESRYNEKSFDEVSELKQKQKELVRGEERDALLQK